MEVNRISVDTLSVKQFAVGNYSKRDGTQSFFVYALGNDGNIYRLDDRAGGFIMVPMNIVQPLMQTFNEEAEA